MAKAYEIKSDWSKIKKEFKRLRGIPTAADKRKLDFVLTSAMNKAQMQTHIDTGSLISSFKLDSAVFGKIYIGEFEAGGSSYGINNPVDYAIYEAGRGGEHNFMRGVKSQFHPMWVVTIKEILKG